MSTERDRNILNMIMNPLMPTGNVIEEPEEITEEDYSHLPNYSRSRVLEIEGIRLAEEKKSEKAVEKFTEAIELCPQNPSAYNNRAQTLQLQKKMDEALNDIDKAIELSKGQGKTAGQAFAQKGLILRCQGKPDEARENYQRAAKLGNKFAKMELVTLNPYSAMCNQMLNDVMEKLRQGE